MSMTWGSMTVPTTHFQLHQNAWEQAKEEMGVVDASKLSKWDLQKLVQRAEEIKRQQEQEKEANGIDQ